MCCIEPPCVHMIAAMITYHFTLFMHIEKKRLEKLAVRLV